MDSKYLKSSLLVIILILALLSCTREPTEPIKVGIATWPGFAPSFIAKEKRFFGDLPVEISILDDFSIRQNAFTSGKTQVTISTLDSYAFESGQGVEGKVIMILDESFGADAIVVSPKIQSATDIKGKKVAYTRGSPSHFFLIQYLRKNGLSMNDISRIEVDDPGRAGDAFFSGSVDVAVTWEPNITQIVNSGKGRVLESTKTAPELIFDVMVVSPQLYEKRKGDIQRFVNGWLQAVEYIKSNPSDAYSIMARNLKIPENEFPQMAGGLRYADLKRNREILLPAKGSKAIHIFDEATKVWLGEKLISAPQSGGNLITSEFIEGAK
jgi:NitT/TauT family transport system substrate-binding protein